ncbi:taste receptor type 2 member 7-like [Podarcis raffonei]|uniref:taste receptor type 2 member 7-like n=1 Tax=Podarcis raffonei TaxID=65483 RepID=UPI0023292CCD|nr:taste receptor type 2 member 7-like [Podarcis raffonei]
MGITTPFGIFFQTFLAIESAVAFLGNGFIIVVNGHRWLQNRKMAPCDFLLTSLSTSRIMLQLTIMMNNILYNSLPENYMRTSTKEIGAYFWLFLSSVSLWCATWLDIFYCVKVTNFPHHLFLWLKLRIDVLVSRLLGMVIIALMLFSVPPTILYFENKKLCNLSGTLTQNASLSKVCKDPLSAFRILQFCSMCMSFILSVTASVLFLISLWRHMRNLRKSGSAIKDFSTQVYLNVMKSLLFSVFFGITYFAALLIRMANFYMSGTNMLLVFDLVLSALLSAHSVILILSNAKLKVILMHILNLR